MALSASALSAALKSAFAPIAPLADSPDADGVRQQYCDTLASVLITYLVANNIVTVETADGPGSGKFT